MKLTNITHFMKGINLELFIEEDKKRVIINSKIDMKFKTGNDNLAVRCVELVAHDKSYFFPLSMFIGNKDIMCCVIYGKEAVNLFKVKQDVIIHKEYNTAGLQLGAKNKESPLYFIKRKND